MIIQLRNPAGIYVLHDLLSRAFSLKPWPNLAVVEKELERLTRDPKAGILLGLEEHQYRAISVIILPISPLDTTPQVIHLYNEGSRALRKELVQATVDFIEKNGYNSFVAVNYTSKDDKVWKRVMQPTGWEIKPIGTLMEFSRVELS